MKLEKLEARLEGIQTLLSHLHGEITALDESYIQLIQLLVRMESVCETDDMTGLLRRRPFLQKWKLLLRECQELNEDCGFILIDVDHFKKVNDTYGHMAGDEVLMRISSLLKQFKTPRCLIARYGGEEFALAIAGNEFDTQRLAEQVRQAAAGLQIQVRDTLGESSVNKKLQCTLSAGVASARKVGFDTTRLLCSADRALYSAKHAGRNRTRAA